MFLFPSFLFPGSGTESQDQGSGADLQNIPWETRCLHLTETEPIRLC